MNAGPARSLQVPQSGRGDGARHLEHTGAGAAAGATASTHLSHSPEKMVHDSPTAGTAVPTGCRGVRTAPAAHCATAQQP